MKLIFIFIVIFIIIIYFSLNKKRETYNNAVLNVNVNNPENQDVISNLIKESILLLKSRLQNININNLDNNNEILKLINDTLQFYVKPRLKNINMNNDNNLNNILTNVEDSLILYYYLNGKQINCVRGKKINYQKIIDDFKNGETINIYQDTENNINPDYLLECEYGTYQDCKDDETANTMKLIDLLNN